VAIGSSPVPLSGEQRSICETGCQRETVNNTCGAALPGARWPPPLSRYTVSPRAVVRVEGAWY
jgi:hypothetical protein